MYKQKVLVTGGSGFIGTNLIEKLIDDNYEVINIDICVPRIRERLDIWRDVDVRDQDEVLNTFKEFMPEYVIHLAARTDLKGKSIDDYNTNTIGVENILYACSCCKSIKKIIITSSMLVCKTGYYPKDEFDYMPSTVYGESKVITERIVWNNLPKCEWAIIRPTSIWGPWFGEPYKNFFDMVIRHRYCHIGHRSCTKTYGYVGNAIDQIEKILFSNTLSDSRVFYIGDYEPYLIEEWADEIATQLGFKIIRMPYIIIRLAAFVGDVLGSMGISFPMTSFRLCNMTTDNIIDLSQTQKYAPVLLFSRKQGIEETLKWITTVGDDDVENCN